MRQGIEAFAERPHHPEPRRTDMSWMEIDELAARVRLAEGYRFELMKRPEITGVVGCIKAWFPAICVGGASCYMREDFFRDKVFFAGEQEHEQEKDVLVVLIKKGQELTGLFSCERERDTQALYARLSVVAPAHRGAHLGQANVVLAEAIGRQMGAGLIYGMATLKIPHVQMAFETLGWQLIGITPGIRPGDGGAGGHKARVRGSLCQGADRRCGPSPSRAAKSYAQNQSVF